MNRNKLIQACLDWKKVYLFWAISFLILIFVFLFPNGEIIWQVYWWIVGSITTILGFYHLYQKHWLNGLLYLCLFLFPMIAFKMGMLTKEWLI